MRRRVDALARRLLKRHRPCCRRCGIAGFASDPTHDALVCVCGRRVTRLQYVVASPTRVWLFGL